jgi:hypothetical protein
MRVGGFELGDLIAVFGKHENSRKLNRTRPVPEGSSGIMLTHIGGKNARYSGPDASSYHAGLF